MKRKNQRRFKLWLTGVSLILVLGIYLNRAYAYFFHYLGSHEIVTHSEVVAHPYFMLPLNSLHTDHNWTYLALGDSLTRGVGVDNDQQAYPFLIAQNLSQKNPIDYTDLGIPGSTTADLLKNQIPFLGDGTYQYLSVLIGINDVLTAASTDKFRANYQSILDQMTKRTPTLIVINIPYLSSSQIMLPPYNFLVDWRTRQFNSIIESAAHQKQAQGAHIIYIDLYDKTKQPFSSDQTLFSQDKFHPSAKGYKLWSDVINASISF